MITQNKIDEFKKLEGIEWVSALRKSSIKPFLNNDRVQELRKKRIVIVMGGNVITTLIERFIACYNH